jgi:hypothetical protein
LQRLRSPTKPTISLQRLRPPTKPKYTVEEAEAAYRTNNFFGEALLIPFMEVAVTSGSILIWRLSKHFEASWLLYNISLSLTLLTDV